MTLADLSGGGVVHLAPAGTCTSPLDCGTSFPETGQWTPVSVAGVVPSACLTWFQAAQACALSGKRLLRNGEWQQAVAGTPDPGSADDGSTTCATHGLLPVNTGSRSSCKSSWGALDMVGNVRMG